MGLARHIWPAALREPQKFVNSYPLESDGRNFAAALFELEHRQDHLRDALKAALNFVLFEVDDYQIDLVGTHLVGLRPLKSQMAHYACWEF